MKKLLALLLAIVMVLSLFAACSDNDDDDEDEEEKTVKGECEVCAEEAKLYEVEQDDETIMVCKDCKKAIQANENAEDEENNLGNAVVKPVPEPNDPVREETEKEETSREDEKEDEPEEETEAAKPSYNWGSMTPAEVKAEVDAMLDRYEELTTDRIEAVLADDWDAYDENAEEFDLLFDNILESYMYLNTSDLDLVQARLEEQMDRLSAALNAS